MKKDYSNMPEDTLGQRLRKYRYVNGISIHKLASQFGVADSTFFSWENGSKTPGSENLKKILKLLEA